MMILCWSGTSYSEIKLGYKGTVLNEQSYIVPVEDGKKTVLLLKSNEVEIKAYKDIITSKDKQIENLLNGIEEYKVSVENERNLYNHKITTLTTKYNKEKNKRFGIGLFTGYNALDNNFTIGIGITYNIFKF